MKRTFPISVLLLLVIGMNSFATAGTLEFTQSTYTVAENGSSFDVSVTRSGNVSAGASVTVRSISGTATVAEDFTNMSQVLTWTAGEIVSKSVTVTVQDDGLIEGDEVFSLELSGFVGDTPGSIATADVTITDFEEGMLSFVFTTYSSDENSETAGVNVIRQSGSNGIVSALLQTEDMTALSSSDYEEVAVRVEFAEGETAQVVHIPVVNDTIAEFPETLEITLSAPEGGATLGVNQSAIITISDSDTDFTPALDVIEGSDEEIIQPSRVNLNQPVVDSVETNLLDAVNLISILESTDLSIDQSADGLLELPIGDETIYLSPLMVSRTETAPSIVIRNDSSGELIVDGGISISFQPGLKGLSVLQTELALISMPELVVTSEGNITVQIDQGPPPLERTSDGVVFINNRYWDRFNLRPSSVAYTSPTTTEGIQLVPHPTVPGESSVLVIFSDGTEFKQQLLDVAPLSYPELLDYVQKSPSLAGLSLLGSGLVQLEDDGVVVQLFSDYVVRRVEGFSPNDVGIEKIDDINNDGLTDYNVVYASGDEQYFLSVSSP